MKRHFFVLAAVFFSTQLSAQQDTTLLNEVVVTANKFPNKTSLTGKVITVINRQELERSGGKDLSQLLTEQAGLYINGANSNTGKDKSVYLRGGYVSHTLITIDGIPVYDASGIGGNFDLRNLSISNIERIEILKGSQSTLYGSDAIDGVINIITKKNSTRPLQGESSISYGSNQTFRGNIGLNGQLKKLDYQASYSLHTTKGINEAADEIHPVTDKDKFQQQAVQFRLGIHTTDKITIQPFFRWSSIHGDLDQGAFTDELDYTYKQKSWQAGLRNEISWGKSKVTVLYNYNNINRSYTDDSTKSRNGFDTYSHGAYKGAEHFADAYFTVPVSSSIKLTVGSDYRSSQSDQDYLSIGFFGPFSTKYSKDSLHQSQVGVYAAANWNHKSGFNLEAGGRVNIHSTYGSHAVFNVNPSYLLHKQVKLFANLSSAYRTPSLYQLFSEYGNRDLKPEAAITSEAGVQLYDRHNKFSGRAVYFNRYIKDIIFFYYNASTFTSQYINQDKQKDHGVELELNYKASKTTVRAFYTYVTGNITTRSNNKDTTYNNLLRRPASSIGLNIGYQIRKNVYFSTNLAYTGSRKDAYFDNNSFNTVYTTLKSYILWDMYGEYGFMKNKWKIFVDLRNITNTKYTEISGFNTLRFNGYGGIHYTF